MSTVTLAADAATSLRPAILIPALAVSQMVTWGALYYAFSLFVVPMEAELGFGRAAMNGALSLGLLVAGLLALPIGSWIDRHGGRLVLSAGSALGAAMLIAWSQIDSIAALYLVWIGIGAAMAANLYEPVFAVITRLFAASFRQKITFVTLLGGFASTAFVPLTQFLILELGWRHALLALGLIMCVIPLPVHLLLRDRERGAVPQASVTAAPPGQPLRRALRNRVFWALLTSFVAYFVTFSALTFHLVPLLTERGFGPGFVVSLIAVIGPAQVAGRIVLLAFGRRARVRVVGVVITAMFPASVLLLLLLPQNVVALFAFALLYGAANGIMTIVRGLSVPDMIGPEGYGAISGALTLPSNVGKAAAPLAAALIWEWGGYDAVLVAILVGGLLCLASFYCAAAWSRP